MCANATDRIRMLNDELRRNIWRGGAVMTPGIAALGQDAVQRLVKTLATFDDFCTANDHHGEHDFGSFEFDGTPVMFKIAYYARALQIDSADLADPDVT